MIESIENGIQICTTGIGAVLAAVWAAKTGKREWYLLFLSCGGYFLGDLYFQIFLIFYDKTPMYADIPYFSWAATYLFLFLLLVNVRGGRVSKIGSKGILWVIPVFVGAMCAFFIYHGDVLWSLVDSVFMCIIMWVAADGLLDTEAGDRRRGLYIAALAFCIFEHCAWTASCFWLGDTIVNPYFWFDTLLSANFLLLVPALRKAVGE